MTEPTLDRLEQKKREELRLLFPNVVQDVKSLCSGDAVALMSKTFEERSREWQNIQDRYDKNLYLGDFFSRTIHTLHEVKAKAHLFEKAQKDLVKNLRKIFFTLGKDKEDEQRGVDGITVDLLVAILINRSFRTSTELYPGFNIHREAAEIIDKLTRANELGEVVEPKDFTLEYIVRAILKRQLAISSD